MRDAGLLRTNPTFRHLWTAKVGSLFGDWFNQVALGQITLALTHLAASLGIVLLSRSLPSVILGPFVGPVVDRFPKKPLLVATDLLRAACAFGYSFAVIFHANWMLYIGSLLLGITGVVFNPARNATIPLAVAVSPVLCFAINAASYLWSALSILRARWEDVHAPRDARPPYLPSLRTGFREAARNRVARAIIFIGMS